MTEPTASEQYLLELTNYVRMNPKAGFDMFLTSIDPPTSEDRDIQNALSAFNVDGAVLAEQIDELKPAQPLLWNATLGEMADFHSENMLENDVQAHTIGDSTLVTRANDFGYDYRTIGENVFAYSESEMHAHAGFLVDWGPGPTGIQEGAGHRVNIMNPNAREVGLSMIEAVGAEEIGPFIVTQNFGTSFGMADTYIVGVAYGDEDGDAFYSVGEAMENVKLKLAGGQKVTSSETGGYQMEAEASWQNLIFSGRGVDGKLRFEAKLPDGTAKIDLVDGARIESSVSLRLGENATEAELLGRKKANLFGTKAHETLVGNDGKNKIKGSGGRDEIDMGGGRDKGKGGGGRDSIDGGGGKDVIVGGRGQDMLTGGKGADTFKFSGKYGDDVITDLEAKDSVVFGAKVAPTAETFLNSLTETQVGVFYDGGRQGSILFEGATLDEVEALAATLA